RRLEAALIDDALLLVERCRTTSQPGAERALFDSEALALFVDVGAALFGRVAQRLEVCRRELVGTLEPIDLLLEPVAFRHHLVKLGDVFGARIVASDQRAGVLDQLVALGPKLFRLHERLLQREWRVIATGRVPCRRAFRRWRR